MHIRIMPNKLGEGARVTGRETRYSLGKNLAKVVVR